MSRRADKSRAAKLASLAKTLFGIGCIGFGGGSALIPVFQDRAVSSGTVTEDELNDDIAIACVTPGALPVEIAAGIGRQTNGVLGSMVGAASIALPGAVLLLLVVALLSQFSGSLIQQVNFLAVGISAYILSVLYRYVAGVLHKAPDMRAKVCCVLIIVLVFAVTCEQAVHKLLGLDQVPVVFGIGTINVMALAFFFIVWLRGIYTPQRVVPAVALAVVYCLCAGGLGFASGTPLRTVLVVVMWVMALWSLVGDLGGKMAYLTLARVKVLLKECAALAVLVAVCALPALLLCGDTLGYLASGALSSILSFGGGDAYIAMAEGMFVEGGMMQEADFYSQLVPVSNALPGSILCKMLTGVGYYVGFRATGSVAVGLAVAFAGFVCAVGMSCLTFAVGFFLYEGLEQLASFTVLKKTITAIIAGLLLTVGLGLLNTCAGVDVGELSGYWLVLLCLLLTAANIFMTKRFGSHPLVLVLGSALVSCLVCNLLVVWGAA